MPSRRDDLYLQDLTPHEALLAWQQVADIALNGDTYEPVGHEALDTLAEGLLRARHQEIVRIVHQRE